MKTPGILHLVSVGPGSAELIPPMAESALRSSGVIVGYGFYLGSIERWIEGKEVHALPLTKERERAARAIEAARAGHVVSLVSGGDVGVYAMAGLVLEEMRENEDFELKIIPGISAANSCASLLGSPLSHDFATLSLSDLLCPWEWIEHRARRLAEADLVIALYNVQSRARRDGVYRILRMLLDHKPPHTCCGVVRNAYRAGQEHYVCALADLPGREFDMSTTIIVGNRYTRRKSGFIYTPRGYNSWALPEAQGPEPSCRPPVWVFSGTSDGNALASELARRGYDIIVSTASEYGRELAMQNCPGLAVRSGRIGADLRRSELKRSGARAIVDATHPFATEISGQLMALAADLGIPYVRFERPDSEDWPGAVRCGGMETAAGEAARKGARIFLATGTKDLAAFLTHPLAPQRQWFARVAPEPSSMECALRLGIPRAHLCAMQGPFTRELNEALWKSWRIDCVVTKDSGEAGGFREKAEAAQAVNAALIVVDRPRMSYPDVSRDLESTMRRLADCLSTGPIAH